MDHNLRHIELEERDFAFQNRIQTFSVINRGYIDIRQFFEAAYEHFERQISSIIETQYLVKVSICFVAVFEKVSVNGDNTENVEEQTIYLHSKAAVVDFESDLIEFYEEFIISFILKRIEEIELRGSGFTLSEINELNVQVNYFSPLSGSSFIALPKFLKSKKTIINVENNDNQCFKYAVLSALYPAQKHAQRPRKYKQYADLLNFTNIPFPVKLLDIKKFEQQNPTISINVYMYHEKDRCIHTIRFTKEVKKNHIHLLILTENSDKSNSDTVKFHFCWIKNLGALLGRQSSTNCKKKLFCDRCLNYFTKLEQLEKHREECMKQNECQIEMPTTEDNKIEFNNFKRQLKVPFVIYADVESMLKKPTMKFCNNDSANTTAYQEHEAYSIGYYFHCLYDESLSYYKKHRGRNCADWFTQQLEEISNKVETIFNQPKPLELSDEDEVIFIISDDCHICGKPFQDNINKYDIRIRDHCHFTGIHFLISFTTFFFSSQTHNQT